MHNHIIGRGGLNSFFSIYIECSWCWIVCFICFNGVPVLKDQMNAAICGVFVNIEVAENSV